MIIYIGSDHRGFEHKEVIKKHVADLGYEIIDVGNEKYDKQDDFSDFAEKVAQKIVLGDDLGILICGSGVGMDIVANKFPGVRSALVSSVEQAVEAKKDDDVNVLTLASDFTSIEDSKKIVGSWLEAKFSGEDRYKRRIKKIHDIEGKICPQDDISNK